MAFGWMARRLTAMIVTGLVCAVALAHASHAQQGEDPAALNAEVERLYRAGKYAEATEVAKRVLAIAEKTMGPEHPAIGTSLNNLAELYRAQGRYAEAEPLFKRSLGVREKALGPEHPAVGITLNNLAVLYQVQGRATEAEPLFKRDLAIREKALGPEHPAVGITLNNLAELYRAQGRYAEAEPLYRRGLNIREKALGTEHLDVGHSLNALAALYLAQGRYTDAEPLFRRGLAITEKVLGPDHPAVGTTLNNMAQLYLAQGRYAEAESAYKRSLAVFEKMLGPEHPDVGTSLNNLAELHVTQGRYAEAEPLFKRSLVIREKALGSDHPDVGASLTNLAALYLAQRRFTEAEPLFKRDLAITEKALGSEHPDVRRSLNNLAALAYAQSDWARAADYWRSSTGVIRRRADRGLADGRGDAYRGEAQRLAWQFWSLVKTSHRLPERNSTPTLAAEMFETAQWAQGSEAAASLAQMAARSAKGSPQLAGIVRERQDLVGEWQAKDKLLIAAKSELPAKRNADTEKMLADRLAAIDTRLAEIDRRLAQDFPDYAALASPAPVSVAEVQARLGPNEALIQFLDTPEKRPLPEETFVWVITKREVRWVRSEMGTTALKREVATLRCGLDASNNWGFDTEKGRLVGKSDNCRSLAPEGLKDGTLPFDLKRSHELYRALFGAVEELIKGKQLLLVPSGPLTTLPFQVLITEAPKPDTTNATAAWLGTRHGLTVLPAVSSLKALRANAKPSQAREPYVGIGNPLLSGEDGQDKRAWERQTCPSLTSPEKLRIAIATLSGKVTQFFRGGLGDVAELRLQPPLPETADELCAVARAQGVSNPDSVVYLGERATEARIKMLSADGTLARTRIIHFATHGLVAGEMATLAEGRAEPALILTPPQTASEEDDGLLTASEIAGLKLDADWVLLSACNTAAGNSDGGDALSGLARAFFYAGARAMLVSHWAVDSEATVTLITRAFEAQQRNRKIGRAEALRQAMTSLISSDARLAHPSAWAPFIVVGEGGAGM